jgi:transposase
MTTMTDTRRLVTGGVDTHADTHVAAIVDELGRVLGTASFTTTEAGNRQLLAWLQGHGELERVGVEGTGAYGAGLARFLAEEEVPVVEVDRPDRKTRRLRGKSDPVDAEAAARAALSGRAAGAPKSRDGAVEAIRSLRVVRRSAVQNRTQAINQLRNLLLTAPSGLRDRFRATPLREIIATASRFRPGALADPTSATKFALRELAWRIVALNAQIARIDTEIAPLVAATAPKLMTIHGVGTEVAAALLVTVGDNPGRLANEAAFAHLCGVAPIPASSGRTTRHRLNRGGDRSANNALWRIAMVRMSSHPPTRAYVERRTKEGLTKRDILRCLKRYIAREIYAALPAPPTPSTT